MKDKKIQGRVIVFISGKMISTGGKNIRNSVEQLKHTVEILAREKIIENKDRTQSSKRCSDANVGGKIDLNNVVLALPEFTLDPEQFAGALHRLGLFNIDK